MLSNSSTELTHESATNILWECCVIIQTCMYIYNPSGARYRLTLGCRKYTRGSYQYCARAKPESGTDN